MFVNLLKPTATLFRKNRQRGEPLARNLQSPFTTENRLSARNRTRSAVQPIGPESNCPTIINYYDRVGEPGILRPQIDYFRAIQHIILYYQGSGILGERYKLLK